LNAYKDEAMKDVLQTIVRRLKNREFGEFTDIY